MPGTTSKVPVAIHIGARQLRALSNWGCSDTPVEIKGVPYYRDFAKYNEIRDNTFINNITSIRVEDDGTMIKGNTFTSIKSGIDGKKDIIYDIYVANSRRNDIGEPIRDTIIENNTTRSVSVNSSGRTMIAEHGAERFTQFIDNTTRLYKPHCQTIPPLLMINLFSEQCTELTNSCTVLKYENNGWRAANRKQCPPWSVGGRRPW